MTEPIRDNSGREVAPPQTWPAPTPKPRTCNVIVRDHARGIQKTVHGITGVVGYGPGVLLLAGIHTRERISFNQCSIEVVANGSD